jgi:hypothetical protein
MRYKIAETPNILGKFNTGATVIIALYDLADESAVALSSNVCNELGAIGVFYWATSNITTQPTAKKEYVWVMTDGTSSQYGKIVLGGYPENIDQALSTTESNVRGGVDTLATVKTAVESVPILSEIEDSTVLAKTSDITGAVTAINGHTDVNLDQKISTTESNIRGVDSDTLKTLSDQIDDVPILSEIEGSTVLAKEATVVSLASVVELLRKLGYNRLELNQTDKTIDLYDDAGNTVLYRWDSFNAAGVAAVDETYRRVPR